MVAYSAFFPPIFFSLVLLEREPLEWKITSNFVLMSISKWNGGNLYVEDVIKKDVEKKEAKIAQGEKGFKCFSFSCSSLIYILL